MRLTAALAAIGLLLVGAPAPAGAAAGCAGVTVVVDFGALGGGVRTGCAAGDPDSGLTALAAAGFGYRSAARFAGFVCRIDDLPATDPCVNASPADAYWSYWHGTPGGPWVYSDTGASAHDPAPGAVEGWAFGAGGRPGITPPAPATTEPPPARAQPPGAQPPGPQPPSPQPPEPRQPDQPAATTAPVTTAAPPPPTTTPPPTTSTGSTTSTSPPAGITPVASERTPDGPGGVIGTVAGLAVIALLAALGFRTARRRRRAG
ncbi:hypothetical protein [Saccharothrix obliqua]|uniref:hypothetical protein n=1 Tax=Saccharothrix obliqua TaxID=2861747 RepID=UPI001C5E0BD5|nr:hypothetical protein [Saccharothrix obliqua]MBW4718265.1 hypothetical protein [Saccharothrix obliqua]